MIRILIFVTLLYPYVVAQSVESAGVNFPEAAYDFGTVKQGSKIVHSFTVKNTTATPLTIRSVELSMPGMHARFAPAVAPNAEGRVTIEWDTAHVSGEIAGEATILFADDSQPSATLQLKGVVRPPLDIQPLPAVFLSVFRGEDNESRLRIVNNEAEPAAISISVAAGKHFIASLTTIEPGRVYELVARVPAAVLPGRYDEELSLSTDNPKLGSVNIPVHVFVKPDLYANPEAIDFGRVSVEDLRKNPQSRELSTQTFLVKKREGEFEIKKVSSDLPGLEVRKDPPHGKSSTYRIDVALNPQKIPAGKLDGFVEIETNDRDLHVIKVPVTGRVF
jgi:hypothetical protein